MQTTSVATATMPLAAGFVGVIPAMAMLTADENPPEGPHTFTPAQLVLWSLALAAFGVFAAVPLRQQVIEREQLRFPSGTATAHVIRALHARPAAGSAPTLTRTPQERGLGDSLARQASSVVGVLLSAASRRRSWGKSSAFEASQEVELSTTGGDCTVDVTTDTLVRPIWPGLDSQQCMCLLLLTSWLLRGLIDFDNGDVDQILAL